MAYNNYQQDRPTPSVRGLVNFTNATSTLDKTKLICTMWSSTIKLEIFPIIESNGDEIKYDRKNGIAIFLIPLKAHLLAQLLRDHLQNPEQTNNYGISTKSDTLVTIENGKSFGRDDVGSVLCIRHIENGVVKHSYAYEFNTNYHVAIVGYDEKTGNFEKDTERFKNAEIEALIDQLEQFYIASTNAQAFATYTTMYPALDKMALQMGLDLTRYDRPQQSQNSYFNSPAQNNNNNYGQPQQSQNQQQNQQYEVTDIGAF